MKESAEKCPFCGEIPFLVTESELRCHCYAVFKNIAPLGELLYLWNRRPIEDALRAEVGSLKALITEWIQTSGTMGIYHVEKLEELSARAIGRPLSEIKGYPVR